jgi:hypothetical protein
MRDSSDIKIRDIDKRIYNQYLITTRSVKGKPFKIRREFKDFDISKIAVCNRIANKLFQYPFIKIEDFFYAPFFNDPEQYVEFEFYSSPRAITAYTKYMLYLESLPPDDYEMLKRVKDSLIFIRDFCKHNNMEFKDYFSHASEMQYTCIMHIKERRVWVYALIQFDQFNTMIHKCDKDVVRLMCGDNFFDKIDHCRSKYLKSSICKPLVQKIIKKLNLI